MLGEVRQTAVMCVPPQPVYMLRGLDSLLSDETRQTQDVKTMLV